MTKVLEIRYNSSAHPELWVDENVLNRLVRQLAVEVGNAGHRPAPDTHLTSSCSDHTCTCGKR